MPVIIGTDLAATPAPATLAIPKTVIPPAICRQASIAFIAFKDRRYSGGSFFSNSSFFSVNCPFNIILTSSVYVLSCVCLLTASLYSLSKASLNAITFAVSSGYFASICRFFRASIFGYILTYSSADTNLSSIVWASFFSGSG